MTLAVNVILSQLDPLRNQRAESLTLTNQKAEIYKEGCEALDSICFTKSQLHNLSEISIAWSKFVIS